MCRREKSSREKKGTGPCAAAGWEGRGWLLSSMRKQQQALCKEQVRERMERLSPKKLQPRGTQQDVSKGNGGSVRCKSLRSMASAQP